MVDYLAHFLIFLFYGKHSRIASNECPSHPLVPWDRTGWHRVPHRALSMLPTSAILTYCTMGQGGRHGLAYLMKTLGFDCNSQCQQSAM